MSVENRVLEELVGLRTAVSGVDGCMVATSDGLLVAHNLPDEEQSQLAALVAALAGLTRHAAQITDRGHLLDVVVRASSGYVVVNAVGETAVLAVLGRSDVNIALLQLRTKPVVQRLATLAAGFIHFTPGPPAAGPSADGVSADRKAAARRRRPPPAPRSGDTRP